MLKTYLTPSMRFRETSFETNFLLSGDGNAPAFDGYTTEGEIPWDSNN